MKYVSEAEITAGMLSDKDIPFMIRLQGEDNPYVLIPFVRIQSFVQSLIAIIIIRSRGHSMKYIL